MVPKGVVGVELLTEGELAEGDEVVEGESRSEGSRGGWMRETGRDRRREVVRGSSSSVRPSAWAEAVCEALSSAEAPRSWAITRSFSCLSTSRFL